MISKFFLKRPVFAWVIAIIFMAAGALAIYNLPISQYPPIAPPSISVTATYPGASAETVENSVTQIIEQKLTGFDNMLYMTATSDSAGSCRIELTFVAGTDPDMAWSQVQNKLQLAMASLPAVVQNQGVKVHKSTRNYLMVVGLISEDGSMKGEDLRDYAQSNLEKVLSRVPGVGEVEVFGAQYAMRVWLDPDRLTNFGLTITDVTNALKAYNVEVSAGQFGSNPAVSGQRLNASVIVQTMLKTPEEFGVIPVRTNPDGSVVRVRDVGRTEMGTESYQIEGYYNNMPAGGLAIRQAAGANALQTADNVKAKMEEMKPYFPAGMIVVYGYDTTPFIRAAIGEVVKTLFEAILLVFLVMYLFMGNMRATLIPTIAVPVVILGTFAVLGVLGFSINMLTMFAMVLAIGLLVDDAIVVVENVERIMEEEGLSPMEATLKSMDQITSALIGIGLVLSAVFAPMAFFKGSTGVIYRQFSVTIISAMLLSVVVALVLTPVLCASLLRPVRKVNGGKVGGIGFMRHFFSWFENKFLRLKDKYVEVVGRSLAHKTRYLAAFLVVVAVMCILFVRMPTGYLPDEDQGVMMVQIMLPANSTFEQTRAVTNRVSEYFADNEKDAVESVTALIGISLSGRGQNCGMAFVKLKDWDLRLGGDLKADQIVKRAMPVFSKINNAMVFPFIPPSVVELGQAQGFDFELIDRGGLGHEKLMEARNQLLVMAAKDPALTKVRPNGLEDVPEYHLDINWEKAGALGVPISAIHNTVSAAFGSQYVNDFIQAGRVKRVYVQADAPYRMLPSDLDRLYVRNNAGLMAPYSSFATGHWTSGSPRLERFNGFPSINILGEPAKGRSSGEAMADMEGFVEKLPQGMGFDWSGLSYQERQAGSQAAPLYAFSIFVIFLCLAALYESWPIPISILMALPLGVIGGVIASSVRGLPNDVYFQIGLLTTLGLTTKNAILIVQFAKARVEQGVGLIDATLEAAKLRMRPIVMTSLAFGFGVLPLALATGAGAGAQKAIGTAVLGGVVTSTFLVTIFAPLFFVLIEKTFGKSHRSQNAGAGSAKELLIGIAGKVFGKGGQQESTEWAEWAERRAKLAELRDKVIGKLRKPKASGSDEPKPTEESKDDK
jgi:HAE1 family hydrophobic/amphiphilic exporter-1